MKKIMFICAWILCTFLANAQVQKDINQADIPLRHAHSLVQELYTRGAISFKTPADEATFTKAMMQLQTAIAAISSVKKTDASSAKLDKILHEARIIQSILSAYLGNKEFFGYELRRNPISVYIDDIDIYEALWRRLPFLGRVTISGQIRLRPGEEVVTQFNSLKTEFYSLLVEAAYLNPADSRLKNLAKWGNETEVIYPGKTFGDEIITRQQLSNLNLSN